MSLLEWLYPSSSKDKQRKTDWWETDDGDADATATTDAIPADFGKTLFTATADAVFDKKVFARLCRRAQSGCLLAARDGAFSMTMVFLRFEAGDENSFRAHSAARLYGMELAEVFEPAGVAVETTVQYEGDYQCSTRWPKGLKSVFEWKKSKPADDEDSGNDADSQS